MSKQNVMKELRKHLAALFNSRFQGANGAVYAQQQGFSDGYMQALHDLSLATDAELLKLVVEERHTAARAADIGLASIPPGPTMPNFA